MKRIIEIEIGCCGDCPYYNTVEKEQKKRKTNKLQGGRKNDVD